MIGALSVLGAASCVEDVGGLSAPPASGFDAQPPLFRDPDGGLRFVGPDADLVAPIIDAGPVLGERDAGALPGDCLPSTEQMCACTEDRSGRRQCRSDGTLGCCECDEAGEGERLGCLQTGLVGTWQGEVTTPWVEPYRVEVTFRSDGSYAARCLDANCTAFYYGSDGDGDGRWFRVIDLWANDEGVARIGISFGDPTTVTGQMDSIRLSGDQERLEFDFWPVWLNARIGPVHFDLIRVR